MQRVDFLKCILKLFCRVDLKSKHIAATLKQNTGICVQGTEGGKKLNKAVSSSGERKDLEVTCRELSITKAKPNFESLILIDHFGEEKTSKSNQKKSLIYMLCNCMYYIYSSLENMH